MIKSLHYILFQENALYIKKDSFLFEQENMSLFILYNISLNNEVRSNHFNNWIV